MSSVYVDGAVHIPLSLIPSVPTLKAHLTVKQWVMGEEGTKEVYGYVDDGECLVVPRCYGMQLLRSMRLAYDDAMSDGHSVEYAVKPTHTGQYAYQEPVVQALHTNAQKYPDFLVEAATGKGKTTIALSFIARHGTTALVVVDQENLLTQWIGRAKKELGLEDHEIGIIRGPKCTITEGTKIAVAMVQSLSQRRYPDYVYDWAGVVVFDEVHVMAAPTFSRAILQFSARVRIGLSATVDRKDSLQKLIHFGLGEIRVKLTDRHDESMVYYVQSNTVYSWYATISPKTGRIIQEVSEDAGRNQLLVDTIKWMYEQGREVLVVSDRIEQLEALKCMAAYQGVDDAHQGLYCGYRTVYGYDKDPKPSKAPSWLEKGTEYTPVKFGPLRKKIPKKELERVKTEARVIYATYGMVSKGVDIPRLTGGIDCTHRSKAQQVHGRILRKVEDKAVPLWVTVRDINCYRLEHQWLSRIDEYVESNAIVMEMKFIDGSPKIRQVDMASVRRHAHANITKLKKLDIHTGAGGRYTLSGRQE